MRKFSKKVKMSVLFLCVAALVSGCSVNKNTTGGGDSANEDLSSLQGVKLVVAGYRNFSEDPLNKAYADAAKKFTEDYPGIEVEFRAGGGDGNAEDLITAIASGDAWDLQYAYGISVFPGVFMNDMYEPLDDYIDFSDSRISKETVESTKWKGHYYGISNLAMQEIGYAAYNETWMKELGVKTPYEYYSEGNWNFDNFQKLTSDLKAKNANLRVSAWRPYIFGSYYAKLDENAKATITYDSQENREWLDFWRTMIYDYDVNGDGSASKREAPFYLDVAPNLMTQEQTVETNDTIRYISLPSKDGSPYTYITDSHWMVPKGAKHIKAATELAKYMSEGKAEYLRSNYKTIMVPEDYEIWEQALDHAEFLPRFIPGVDRGQYATKLFDDFKAGKTVSTHISENTGALQAAAELYNAELDK